MLKIINNFDNLREMRGTESSMGGSEDCEVEEVVEHVFKKATIRIPARAKGTPKEYE